jgi:hydrogenase maturation protease
MSSSATTTRGKTLVLGLGNILMSDEGVGVHVVREVEKRALPAHVECLDGGTGGFVLLEPMQEAEHIVMIDAAADGNPVGTVTRTVPRFARDYPPTLTAHDIGIKDLLDLFYMLDGGREVTLYAITIDPMQRISLNLSPEIAEAAKVAVEAIVAELNSAEIDLPSATQRAQTAARI